MAARTSVNISITPELDSFLQSRVASGRYQTTGEVVRDALRLLEQQETEEDEGFRRLKAKLQTGADEAKNGDLPDGGVVFEELRTLIEERRQAKAPSR